jgi:hypothetical protein
MVFLNPEVLPRWCWWVSSPALAHVLEKALGIGASGNMAGGWPQWQLHKGKYSATDHPLTCQILYGVRWKPCPQTYSTWTDRPLRATSHTSQELWPWNCESPKEKCPKAVPTHLQNHVVVWSRILECSKKLYVTGPSIKCYFNEFLFTWVLTHDKKK